MLKKTLWRAGFLAQAFLLIAAGNKALVQKDTAPKTPAIPLIIASAKPDSAGLDSISVLTKPEVPLNTQAARFNKLYLKRNTPALEKLEKKTTRYFVVIDSIFTAQGLPAELKYLSVIESKLQTKAVSPVGAVGAWQFMPATARAMGLTVKGRYDERTHFNKSTAAAAKYLKYLHRLFDDWLLVIAAYNGGPGSVYQAIKNSGSRNFWKLQYHLPAETRNHVKRFIAAHYYFEKKGSIVTLSKSELKAYEKALAAVVAANDPATADSSIVIAANNETMR